MIHVLGRNGAHLLVANTNLYRVLVPATGEIVDELVTERRSAGLVAMHNSEHPGELAVAVPYDALDSF